MDVTITARHCNVPDSIRGLAQRRVERLLRYHARAVAATVIFTEEHGIRHAEIRLAVPGNDAFARGGGGNFRAALDQAATRLARQVKRRRAQTRRGARRRDSALPAASGTA